MAVQARVVDVVEAEDVVALVEEGMGLKTASLLHKNEKAKV